MKNGKHQQKIFIKGDKMPNLSKTTINKHKKPYKRSTGVVSEHNQNYHINNKRDAREEYNKDVSVKVRKIDESREHSRTEKLVKPTPKNVKKWDENKLKYDIAGVDDPLPENFEVERVKGFERTKSDKKFYTTIYLMDTKKKKEVGHIILYNNPRDSRFEKDKYAVEFWYLEDEYIGKGYSAYLMREAVNYVDENEGSLGLHNEAGVPVPDRPKNYDDLTDDERLEMSKEHRNNMNRFYDSYDMKSPESDEYVKIRARRKKR